MKRLIRPPLLPLLAALAPLLAAGPAPVAREINVYAAASLTDALNEMKPRYEKAHPGVKLVFVFGASGQLQKQIENGAPADLFLSAAPEPVDAVAKAGLLAPNGRRDLLGNVLVLITPSYALRPRSLADLKDGEAVRRVMIGDPGSVPAGQYAEAALKSAGLYDAVKPKLILGLNVRQVLDTVGRGEADAGFVYRSDAWASDKVRVVAAIDPASHPPIVYPAAWLKRAAGSAETGAFFEYLSGPEAMRVFRRRGFQPPPAAK